MPKEGFFISCPQLRAVLMDNVKSLTCELASISQRFTLEDVQKYACITGKGRTKSPKFLHQIISILAVCQIAKSSFQLNLGLEKPQVFKYSTHPASNFSK